MAAIAMENPGIGKSLTLERTLGRDKQKRSLYELRKKAARDELNVLLVVNW